jgi:hypothetical protein
MPLETLCAILCVVGVVVIFAATLMPARAPQDEHGSPAGSSWTSVSPDVAVRPPWTRATSGALVAGQQAETAMRDLLLAGLPAGTWVLSGLTLPSLGGDIDLLVVGALGAVVLEVKYWAGRIVCGPSGHAWTRTRRGLVEALSDPARQLEGELRGLTGFWHRQGCAVASAVGGLLVFAHPRCELEVAASPVAAVRPRRALNILLGCQAQPLLSEAEQSRLVALVVAAQPSDWNACAHVHRAPGGPHTPWPTVC